MNFLSPLLGKSAQCVFRSSLMISSSISPPWGITRIEGSQVSSSGGIRIWACMRPSALSVACSIFPVPSTRPSAAVFCASNPSLLSRSARSCAVLVIGSTSRTQFNKESHPKKQISISYLHIHNQARSYSYNLAPGEMLACFEVSRQRRISRSVPEGTISDEEVPAIYELSSAKKWRSCSSSRHWLTAYIDREYGRAIQPNHWRLWTTNALVRRRTDVRAQTSKTRTHSVCLLSLSRRNDL